MQANGSSSQGRRVTGNVLIFLTGLILVASASAKLAVPKVAEQMGALGFDGGRLTFVVVLEIASALLFLVPLTRSFGLLMASAYMGGAIATHVQHGQPFYSPAIFLSLLWLGAWLRHPEILGSFASSKAPFFQPAESAR